MGHRPRRPATWALAIALAVAWGGWGGEAWALRPFVAATDADILEPGTIELEAGLGFRRNTWGAANDGILNVPVVVVNLGLLQHFELDLGTGFDLVWMDSTKTDAGRTRLASPAQVALTGKLRLLAGEGGAPSLATELTLLVPSQHRQLLPGGSRDLGFTGVFALTGQVGRLWLHLNLGGGVAASPKDPGKASGSLLWAVAGELPVGDGLAIVGEARGAAAQASAPDTTALGGLTWVSPWKIKFDLGAFAGLTRGAHNWGVTAGVTFAFDAIRRAGRRGVALGGPEGLDSPSPAGL